MYRVTVRTDGKEYLLHDPRDHEMQLIAADLAEEVGKHQTFTFTIPPKHPNKDKIITIASEIMVWRDKELISCSRMFDSQSDFYNTGQATCEGESGYLLDSIQRPYVFTGSARDLFVQLLNVHNSQVDERKRMEPGNLDVTGEIARENTEYSSTLSEIMTNFCTGKDCFFHLRYGADGKKYLDCVKDYGGINPQVIRYGENLVALTKYTDPNSLMTVLIPTGDDVEIADGSGDQKAVDITSVNGGKDYIVHEAAASKFGMIWGTKQFDGVTDPDVLLAKAKAYLDEVVEVPESINIKAIDLSLVDKDVQPFRVGYWTDVISKPHGLNRRMLLAKMAISLVDPRKCEISLGSVRPTFTGIYSEGEKETSDRIASVASSSSKEINRKVENATQLITGAKGGYVVLDVEDPETGKKSMPWRILIMDAPEKEEAHDVIQINKNGIGFSTTGINGPYRNAWTIDGELIADFITGGTMLADRIRGGSLELGGKGLGKDGSLIIKDKSENEIGRIDINGLDIKRGKGIGFKADGEKIQLGDMVVSDAYGRQILQSSDEMTGFSGKPREAGGLYLWAGYAGENDFAFVVNAGNQTWAQTLYLKEWKQSDLDRVEKKFPSTVKLDLSAFDDSVNYMFLERFQWANWLIDTLTGMFNKIDERLDNLERK